MAKLSVLCRFLLLLLLCCPQLSWAQASVQEASVTVLTLNGAVSPASADYIIRGIKQAEQQGARAVILQMDTPGGLDKSMRSIIKTILAAKVPVVSYVAPSGARAASAGTFILYASHIAAMAPGTNLGAASPVSVGGGDSKTNDDKSKQKAAKAQTTKEKKVSNDAIAYIRSLAQMRGRDSTFAEQAVKNAATMTAKEALAANVIDLIADDLTELLKKIDGKAVKLMQGEQTIATESAKVVRVMPDWRNQFLSVITDPSVAYILLLIGVYGLFFEFANPGFVLPGVAGAISLLLALYAFQLLPISYAGLALLILGIVFMIAEALVPSFGALGFGGVVAFIMGSVLLFDSNLAAYQIAWQLIAAMALVNVGFFSVVLSMAMRARKQKVITGTEDLIGREGVVCEANNTTGQAKISGELWTVESDQPLEQGQKITVVANRGLILQVKIK